MFTSLYTHKLTMNGCSIFVRIFFSFWTCSTCLSLITSLIFIIFKAWYSLDLRSRQSSTLPKVPVPVCVKSFNQSSNSSIMQNTNDLIRKRAILGIVNKVAECTFTKLSTVPAYLKLLSIRSRSESFVCPSSWKQYCLP